MTETHTGTCRYCEARIVWVWQGAWKPYDLIAGTDDQPSDRLHFVTCPVRQKKPQEKILTREERKLQQRHERFMKKSEKAAKNTLPLLAFQETNEKK